MTLAAMWSLDLDALICDMAETYHVLDIKSLPIKLLAVLASGLRDESRIKTKAAGVKLIPVALSNAKAVDQLTAIRYLLFHEENESPPTLFSDIMYPEKITQENTFTGYETGAEYEEARQKWLEGLNNG